eukprot:m.282288 g.282288  ORF g.282288 m.282288 type:complete len:75 (-) comp19406_c1_seq4:1970-2194(-)
MGVPVRAQRRSDVTAAHALELVVVRFLMEWASAGATIERQHKSRKTPHTHCLLFALNLHTLQKHLTVENQAPKG